MTPVSIDEITSIAQYEIERETYRPKVMAIKDRRRIRFRDLGAGERLEAR